MSGGKKDGLTSGRPATVVAHCRLVTDGAGTDVESESSRAAGWTLRVLRRRAPRDGSPKQRPVLLEKMRTRVARPGGRAQPLEAQLREGSTARE
jgi:hypothetical protein